MARPAVSPTSSVFPGLTLLLARAVTGSAAATIVDVLETRLGGGRAAVVLDLDLLERNGLEREGPFSGANFERWLADHALEALRSSAIRSETRTRFPVFVVGALEEPFPRRAGLGLPTRIRRALGRLAMPRGLEPIPVAIWTLPDRWTPLLGAELFAWLKEFAAVLGAPEGSSHDYALSFILGRSGHHAPALGDRLSHSDHALAERVAEFIAACHTTRVLDWVFAAVRGLQRRGRFCSLGIAPVTVEGRPGDEEPWLRALNESAILWPTSPPAHAREERVAHGLLGVRHNASVPERFHGWERISPVDDAAVPSTPWICRLGWGLEPRNLLGASNWREHYLRLPIERRRELHVMRGAVDWADPLDAPTTATPVAEINEPVLPVL